MIIREEAPEDQRAVYDLVLAAFGQAAEARLVDDLRAAGDSVVSLVADEGGPLVGHVLLSRMEAPIKALGLAPVSVLPARQNAGIGGALVREAIARAARAGWEAIFVLGDPAYYQRFGFNLEAASAFTCVYAGPHFMGLALTPTLDLSCGGNLAYAPAFGKLG